MNVYFEVISGAAGKSLTITDNPEEGGFRLSGPKPWGGGTVEHTFCVDIEILKEQIKKLKKGMKN